MELRTQLSVKTDNKTRNYNFVYSTIFPEILLSFATDIVSEIEKPNVCLIIGTNRVFGDSNTLVGLQTME